MQDRSIRLEGGPSEGAPGKADIGPFPDCGEFRYLGVSGGFGDQIRAIFQRWNGERTMPAVERIEPIALEKLREEFPERRRAIEQIEPDDRTVDREDRAGLAPGRPVGRDEAVDRGFVALVH